MNLFDKIKDFDFYSRNYQKINTKLDGLQPLYLREYQKRFISFWEEIEGPQRIIVLKPRQAGFSTIIAAKFSHLICTSSSYNGIAMADKKGRTDSIASMYKTFIQELPEGIKPLTSTFNTEKIILDDPRNVGKGLNSGVSFETALDPNAGRSGTRRFAHLSEVAFYRYMKEIDDGVQNSIPIANGTTIIKESTANGRAGIGKSFYDLWNAAKRGDSLYKPFFVAWYEVDDYQITAPRDMKLNPYEKEIIKEHKLTKENIAWRRAKLLEYLDDDENQLASPEERFKQDFPLTDTEAFLSTGAPVFDNELISKLLNRLNSSTPPDLKDRLGIQDQLINEYKSGLKIFTPPRQGKKYFIGADVSEGLAIGDASTFSIIDEDNKQVASWFGKIDADLFGYLLISIGELYNNALIVPERNNMGISTVLVIRNAGYPNLYREMVEDKVTKQKRERFGWQTTKVSKMTMLNYMIKMLRDNEMLILDKRLLSEMAMVAREENGNVVLNGKDRTVAHGLALMGRKQSLIKNTKVEPKRPSSIYDTKASEALKPKRENGDIFG